MTVTVYVVPTTAPGATMNEAAVITPLDIEHVGLSARIRVAGELVIDAPVHVSVGLNPLPEIVTTVPVGPEFGVAVIVGTVVETVKVAVPKSPRVGAVTLTVRTPGVEGLTTVNEPVNWPLAENEHRGPAVMILAPGLLVMIPPQPKFPASPGANPLPDTDTAVRTGPELGVSVIVGVVAVTVKVAETVPCTTWTAVSVIE